MRHPLVLPNHHVQRIIDRDARLLILGRRLPVNIRSERVLNLKEIHNAATIRRNAAHRRNQRLDLQTDPHILTIELLSVSKATLGAVDEKQARAAGFLGVDEFRTDWRSRRRGLDLEGTVHVHLFEVRDARYLHRDVHRGYTHDPGEAPHGEPTALSEEDVERFARQNRERDEIVRAARRADAPIEDHIRELDKRARNGNRDAQRALFAIRQTVERAERKRAVDV